VSEFIKVKVFAERTEFGAFGRSYSVTTNEIEEIIVPISRIVKITPKSEIKCLIDFDTSEGVDTRWCVMSSDEVMALITAKDDKQP
jgi:Mg2+/Co2+ transporter CorC